MTYITLGVVRSKRLVGDLGEALAARYYDVPLAENAHERGYDLVTTDGRLVQVRLCGRNLTASER